MSASSGQNPITGTTYNLYTSPPQTTVNFGSGDSDVFNLDSNTGRMTHYKFNVGSQAVTGALTWNANSTLSRMVITDPFNSSNAQTCNYAHDDLMRIASANCGSIWSQTFSFDAFGNINKSGNSSFSASYSPTTNQMTSIGGSSPSYDANGNVTNDFLHSYAWDANGRPVIIDGVGLSYDALGRMVEQNSSGTYSEIAYAPTGEKLALMSGQTLQKAFVPLTGGATAIYTSSGLDHYRHSDWLGSARLTTTPSRTVSGDVAYAPFGEAYAQSGTADLSFTWQNQDTVGSEYDFPAREYGIQGRWPSPDPAGVAAADPANPQSWNRYAYVQNNPLSFTDPTGALMTVDDDTGEGGGCDWLACFGCDPEFGCWAPFDCFGCSGGVWVNGNDTIYNAPPAPPGGYGAGIDPFGTWDESLPGGVQVFPSGFPGINLPSGSGCTYGSGWCGGVIFGWTKDAAGNVIGDYPGEELCTPGPLGTCLYWNLSARKWQPADNASKLAGAVNKTGVQSLDNPCTVVGWYAAAGTVGAAGAGVANAGEIGATLSEEYPSMIHRIWTRLIGRRPIGGTISAAVATVRAIPAACSKLQ